MAQKKESFFWTSYSDLMTSLFLIMLTLFVIVVVLLHKKLATTQKQLDEIAKIQKSTEELDSTGFYEYNAEHKKYLLKVRCHFARGESELGYSCDVNRYNLKKAGISLKEFLNKHKETHYLLIIEGQASRDDASKTELNYRLSFERALTLMKFWTDSKIDFGSNCEIQIAGSGDGYYNLGYTGDLAPWERDKRLMRDLIEERNQRFLIHIIPKNIMEHAEIDSIN